MQSMPNKNEAHGTKPTLLINASLANISIQIFLIKDKQKFPLTKHFLLQVYFPKVYIICFTISKVYIISFAE